MNISSITTLIVGKNNSGKTTIIEGLNKIINNKPFISTDFNFEYLRKCIEGGIENNIPFIEFKITIDLDLENDVLNNLLPILDFNFIDQFINDKNKIEVTFFVKWEVKEEEQFLKLYSDKKNNQENIDILLDVIKESEYELKYYKTDKYDSIVKNFKLGDLIELKSISANNLKTDDCLTKAFSKIILYKYQQLKENNLLQDTIDSTNASITEILENNISLDINNNINAFEEKFKIALKSDVKLKELMNNLTKYEFVEGKNNIPENQFGLGYTNIIMIVADIIDYIESSEKSFNSSINLISIEEPETYMHPQMQEMFIKNIENMIKAIFNNRNKNLNLQIIITTHSSHILNSKIHFGNTFNDINYVYDTNNSVEIIKLSDKEIIDKMPKNNSNKEKEETLKYIKKYVKYKLSELFFSDAIILVEGVTEEVLLNYYLSKEERFNKYYISVFNINGAFSHRYHSILEILKVPTLIISDLDIVRKGKENLESIISKKTSNASLIYYYNSLFDKNDFFIEDIKDFSEKNNIIFTCQNKIGEFYTSSFEEAVILENYNKPVIIEVLDNIFPESFINTDFIENKVFNRSKSYEMQCKININKKKSEFSNQILMKLLLNEETDFVFPEYIENGLNTLLKKLGGGENE